MSITSLFEGPVAPEAEIPTQFDAFILDEIASVEPGLVAFRWWRGDDANGVTRVFRFQRGLSLAQWHHQLRTQRMVSVSGPFRSQLQAVAVKAVAA